MTDYLEKLSLNITQFTPLICKSSALTIVLAIMTFKEYYLGDLANVAVLGLSASGLIFSLTSLFAVVFPTRLIVSTAIRSGYVANLDDLNRHHSGTLLVGIILDVLSSILFVAAVVCCIANLENSLAFVMLIPATIFGVVICIIAVDTGRMIMHYPGQGFNEVRQ